jgi:hypothetical protein
MTPRSRRGNRDLFVEKLRELSGGKHQLLRDRTLRDALGWDEAEYNRVKNQLFDESAVIVGSGQGGSVGIPKALTAFISYSHVDEQLKNELMKHLEPLRKLGLVDTWHDGRLTGGENWDKSISDKLEKADIILLLISIDFINSIFCYEIELERALELHEQQKARVIPVILRDCLWRHMQFAKLHALPKDAMAVMAWDNIDRAFTNVAEGVKLVAEHLRASS